MAESSEFQNRAFFPTRNTQKKRDVLSKKQDGAKKRDFTPESGKVGTYACDCSASGTLAVRNAMSCQKTFICFLRYSDSLSEVNCIVQAIKHFSTPRMSHNMVKRLDVL